MDHHFRGGRGAFGIVVLRPELVELVARIVVADVVSRFAEMAKIALRFGEDFVELGEDIEVPSGASIGI